MEEAEAIQRSSLIYTELFLLKHKEKREILHLNCAVSLQDMSDYVSPQLSVS